MASRSEKRAPEPLATSRAAIGFRPATLFSGHRQRANERSGQRKRRQLLRRGQSQSNAGNDYPMPNRHSKRPQIGQFCGQKIQAFGFPNKTKPPFLGRNDRIRSRVEEGCSTIRMEENTPCAQGNRGEKNSIYGYDKMCLERKIVQVRYRREFSIRTLRKPGRVFVPFSDTTDLDLPMLSLLTRPSSEVLPVPLGHSDPDAIRTARPPGHVLPLLEAAHHGRRNGRYVQRPYDYSARPLVSTSSDRA